MTRMLLTTAGVAAKLGRPIEWFYKHRRKLAGFPEPVPGCGYRWDPAAIDAWLDRIGGLAAADDGVAGADESGGVVVDAAELAARRRMDERARVIAAGG